MLIVYLRAIDNNYNYSVKFAPIRKKPIPEEKMLPINDLTTAFS